MAAMALALGVSLHKPGVYVLNASGRAPRARDLRRAVARARWLGAHLEAQNTPREQRSEAALHQYPEQVLSEVGKQIAEIPELAELGTLAR